MTLRSRRKHPTTRPNTGRKAAAEVGRAVRWLGLAALVAAAGLELAISQAEAAGPALRWRKPNRAAAAQAAAAPVQRSGDWRGRGEAPRAPQPLAAREASRDAESPAGPQFAGRQAAPTAEEVESRPSDIIQTEATGPVFDPFAGELPEQPADVQTAEFAQIAQDDDEEDDLVPPLDPVPLDEDVLELPPQEPGDDAAFDDNQDTSDMLDQELAAGGPTGTDGCPDPSDLGTLRDISVDISPPPPAEGSDINLPHDCEALAGHPADRFFAQTTYTWKASGLCHKPLYFEEVHLERYGHSWGPILQPVFSGVHFFATVPVLPYKMGIHPPCECQYALGYYRPGSCAPYMIPPLPLSLRGAAFEAGAVLGMVYLVP